MKHLGWMTKTNIFGLILLSMICFVGSTSLYAATREETISIPDINHLNWKDYPGLPGVQFAVLAGDPGKSGIYTIRVKFAPHTMSRPHWHPEERYVTVIKGVWWAGTGAIFDPNATMPVPAGGFAVHTAREIHFDGAKDEEVIVQISGIGPSRTIPVNPDGTDKK